MFSLFLLAAVATLFASVVGGTPPAACEDLPRDCEEILSQDITATDGVHWVCPERYRGEPFEVQCNMQGRGWTMLLKRFDGSVDFNQDWNEMKELVGDLTGEFWLGLENVHRLTTSGDYALMVEFHQGSDDWTAVHNSFNLSGEAENYKLRAGSFDEEQSNTGYDALVHTHNNQPFSTRDRDNTWSIPQCGPAPYAPNWLRLNCGWEVNLFALYRSTSEVHYVKSMLWYVRGQHQHELYGGVYPSELSLKVQRRRS